MKILDVFAGSGQTWVDKDFFKGSVTKNDIRFGEILVGSGTKTPKKIKINPDLRIDILNKRIGRNELPYSEIVYADPPHIVNNTGFMLEAYGTLTIDWREQLKTLFYNLDIVTGNVLIFKWNDRSISVKNIIREAEPYFIPGIKMCLPKTHNKSFMIIFFKRYQKELSSSA